MYTRRQKKRYMLEIFKLYSKWFLLTNFIQNIFHLQIIPKLDSRISLSSVQKRLRNDAVKVVGVLHKPHYCQYLVYPGAWREDQQNVNVS